MVLSNPPDSPQAPVDSHVFLVGRPPIAEFITFVRRSAVDACPGEPAPTDSSLAEAWRVASDHIRTLEKSEAGYADGPDLAPLPPELEPLGERLTADRAFKRVHGTLPTTLGMVELDRLVVFQKHVNLTQVEAIRRTLGSGPTPETIARVALGLDRAIPPVRVRQSQDTYTFISESMDFRFLEPVAIAPESLPFLDAKGVPARCIVLSVGFSPNCVAAVRAGGRLILFNGSHRAYAIREAGITHIPCVVHEIARSEEMDLVPLRDIAAREELYLRNPRPPVLKDYFDSRLRRIVPVARLNRLVRVQFRVDQSDIPGL